MIAFVAAVAMHWLVLDDIHMNPFDSRPRVVYGADTNPALFSQALREMRRDVPDARVVVLGGDFLAHHFPSLARAHRREPYRAAVETIARIARQLDDAFPHAQFLIALGNNDDPCGDYHSEVGGPYARDIARIFAPLVDRNGAAPGFERAFANGGYYTARLPGGMRAVVLNSVLWSFVYRGSCQVRAADPGGAEQRWLARELQIGTSVLLMHIPPGYDAESTTIAHRVLAVPFLSAANDRAFRATLARDRANVAFVLGAHTHRYDFRVPAGVPMLISSSLSPVYRNNPAFYELVVEGGMLVDSVPFVHQRFTGEWVQSPTFDEIFDVKRLNAASLLALSTRIAADPALRARWIQAYDVWSWRLGDVTDHRWQTYRCAQVAFGKAYSVCAGTRNRSIAALIAAAVLVLLVCAAIGLAVVQSRRRRLRNAIPRAGP